MTLFEMVFMGLLAIYFAGSIMGNARPSKDKTRRSRSHVLSLVTQTPTVLMAIAYGYSNGEISRQLFSIWYLFAGLILGHLIFGVSVLITHRSWRDTISLILDIPAIWAFLAERPFIFSRFLLVAVAEELVWRVAAQDILLKLIPSVWVVIALIAVAFSIVHHHFFRNEFHVSLEFIGFALLLGILYHVTGSLLLVIAIHAVRDMEITYLEYLVKLYETGDEGAASRAIQRAYRFVRVRQQ